MNQWITLLQGALAGGAIGAFVSPVIAQRSDRRTARAQAREKLAEAENARHDPAAAFSEILIQLRTAAMIAGVPRSVVEKYISLYEAFRKHGLTAKGMRGGVDRSAPQNWPGFLQVDAVMAASILSSVLWHPWAGRVLAGLRLRFRLWKWRRRMMVMTIQSALIHYTDKGKEPLPFNDDEVFLLTYCFEHLPRHLRSGIPLSSRVKQRLKRDKSSARPATTAPLSA